MRLTWLLPLILLSSCYNPCQQICWRMARYAKECGFEVPTSEIRECLDAQAGSGSEADREVCRDAGSAATLRDEWTCDDLADYWGSGEDNSARSIPDTW